MSPELIIRSLRIAPALMCAPMAGITHSAFRRLASDFGGFGALYTEMIAARALPNERAQESPFSRRRPQESVVIYQLLVSNAAHIAPALLRLAPLSPDALDINLGCPAPEVTRTGGGGALFADTGLLAEILTETRTRWPGPLIVKCRLGAPGDTWRKQFEQRMRIFHDCGVDAIVVHPRFSDEKLKRRAHWEHMPWVCSLTELPVIGNGDIDSLAMYERLVAQYPQVRAFMLGRLAAVRPWIGAQIAGHTPTVDPLEIWDRLVRYIREDFEETRVLGRLKQFAECFARNFAFGQNMWAVVQGAHTPEQADERARKFLELRPEVVDAPSIAGL